tara:strand:- start:13 stop:429 length:417 start_codon:yes stop_codon:yes gene_type:complete
MKTMNLGICKARDLVTSITINFLGAEGPAKVGRVIMLDRGQWYIAENDGISCTIKDAADHDEGEDGMVCEQATPSDARLIAAAPAMLEALEVAKAMGFGGEHPRECYTTFYPDVGTLDCQCGLAIVQAAIDKATWGGE